MFDQHDKDMRELARQIGEDDKSTDRRGGGAGESPLTADTDKFVKQLKDAGAKVTIDGENLSAAHLVAAEPIQAGRMFSMNQAGEVRAVSISQDVTIDIVVSLKWSRFKQLIAIVFHPWRVWKLHDEIHVKEEQLQDLIGDLERVSKQRDDINRSTRRAMLRDPVMTNIIGAL